MTCRSGEGLTQEMLAERIGKSREYVIRLEGGKHPQPQLGLLLLIARALELTETETNGLLLDCGHDQLPTLVPVTRPSASRFLR
jgi:transcriptional regulator with XRE-family HTH domain